MSDHPTPENQPTTTKAVTDLQGSVPPLADPAQRDAAMDQAFDYRGDVTIQTVDGQVIEGYVFDRRREGGKAVVRVMPSKSDERLTIAYEDITRLAFTGKDTAAGKSWETWVKKYVEKKAQGQQASIEAEPLE
jgi:hypothetical protein